MPAPERGSMVIASHVAYVSHLQRRLSFLQYLLVNSSLGLSIEMVGSCFSLWPETSD